MPAMSTSHSCKKKLWMPKLLPIHRHSTYVCFPKMWLGSDYLVQISTPNPEKNSILPWLYVGQDQRHYRGRLCTARSWEAAVLLFGLQALFPKVSRAHLSPPITRVRSYRRFMGKSSNLSRNFPRQKHELSTYLPHGSQIAKLLTKYIVATLQKSRNLVPTLTSQYLLL